MTVLFCEALLPLWLVALCCQAIARQKYRRLWWYGGLLLCNTLLGAGYAAHRYVGGAALWWNGAAFAVLVAGLLVWLATPRSQR